MRVATIGEDGVFRDADGLAQGRAPVRPKPRRSFLSELSQAKTSYRLFAERLSVPARDLAYTPRLGDPERQIYPGRTIWKETDPSTYVLSFRPAPEGKVYLFSTDGPDVGNWKTVELAELSSYRAVREPEARIIRNLAPAVRPALPPDREPGALYPTSLLSGTMMLLGLSFPPKESLSDPSKLKASMEGIRSGLVGAIVMAGEAIDISSASYDALYIGEKALLILRHVGTALLDLLVPILEKIRPGMAENFIEASAMVEKLSRKFPLFGLLLERAYLWWALDAYTDSSILRQQNASFMGDFGRELLRLKKPEEKAKFAEETGFPLPDLDRGLAEAEALLKSYWQENAKFANQVLLPWLKREGLKYRSVIFGARTLPAILERNKRSIERLKDELGISLPSNLEGLGVPPLLSVAAGKGIPAEKRAALESLRRMTSESLKKAPPEAVGTLRTMLRDRKAFQQVYDIMVGTLRKIAKVGAKIDVKDITSSESAERIAKELQKKRDESKNIEEQARLAEAIMFLRSGSARIEPNLIDHLAQVTIELDQIGKAAAAGKELGPLIDRYFEIILAPEKPGIYFLTLSSTEQAKALIEYIFDIQHVLDLPPFGLGIVVHEMLSVARLTDVQMKDLLSKLKQVAKAYVDDQAMAYEGEVKTTFYDPWVRNVVSPFLNIIDIMVKTPDIVQQFGRLEELSREFSADVKAQASEAEIARDIKEIREELGVKPPPAEAPPPAPPEAPPPPPPIADIAPLLEDAAKIVQAKLEELPPAERAIAEEALKDVKVASDQVVSFKELLSKPATEVAKEPEKVVEQATKTKEALTKATDSVGSAAFVEAISGATLAIPESTLPPAFQPPATAPQASASWTRWLGGKVGIGIGAGVVLTGLIANRVNKKSKGRESLPYDPRPITPPPSPPERQAPDETPWGPILVSAAGLVAVIMIIKKLTEDR